MQTLKIKIKQSLIVGIASVIAFSVFLLSIHAKDMVQYREMLNPGRVEYRDINDKAVGELHDHVDKQVLKTFAKTFSDGFTMSRGRDDDFSPSLEEDPGILARLQETLLMWRVYASLPFAVS